MSYISSVPWCTPLGRHCCRLGFAVIIFISQCVYFYFFYHPYSSNGCLTVYSINTFQVCCMHLSDNMLSVCLIVLTWWLCVASIVEGCSRSALVSKCYICCFYFCVGDPLPWVFPVCVGRPIALGLPCLCTPAIWLPHSNGYTKYLSTVPTYTSTGSKGRGDQPTSLIEKMQPQTTYDCIYVHTYVHNVRTCPQVCLL